MCPGSKPNARSKEWATWATKVLFESGGALSCERLKQLWEETKAEDGGVITEKRIELCDMLHDGVLRLVPQRARAWGPSETTMRQLVGARIKPLKRTSKHGHHYTITVTATSDASAAEGSGDDPRASELTGDALVS